MKVLQIGSSLFDWGGIERYVAYLAEGLMARGHEVSVICPPGSPLAQRSPGEKLSIPLRFQFAYWLLPRFTQRLRQGEYDVAHLHFSPDFVVPLLAARAAKIPRVVLTRHVALPWSATKIRRYADKVDRVICVSDAVRGVLAESGVDAAKLVVAKAGCPPLVPTASAAAMRKKLTNDGKSFAVGYFGRLVADKGVQHLVEASRTLASGIAVHLFGNGPLRGDLEAVDSPAVFHGFVPEVADAMAAVDLVVIPSVWAEAFPFAALEAMSLGKPILATRRGGLPEMVSEQTGRLIPAEDPKALAEQVAWFASNPNEAAQLGARAREIQSQEYTIARFAERIESVYAGIGP